MMGTWILAPRYVITPGMQVKVVNSYDATCKPCEKKKNNLTETHNKGVSQNVIHYRLKYSIMRNEM